MIRWRSLAREPQGICGSGLIDGLSELLRTNRINELGRFVDESERFQLTSDSQIFIHEQDISELAQAKGANVAGLRIVLKNYGIDVDDLDRFYLAGGFAKHLDLDAARRIGLIPDLPDEKLCKSATPRSRAPPAHFARSRLATNLSRWCRTLATSN